MNPPLLLAQNSPSFATADLSSLLFLFVVFAGVTAIIRFVAKAISKTTEGRRAEPTWTTETLRDGSYNWTGKPSPAKKQPKKKANHQPVAVPEIAPQPEDIQPASERPEIVLKCISCGAEMGNDWKFCRGCGHAIIRASAPSVAPEIGSAAPPTSTANITEIYLTQNGQQLGPYTLEEIQHRLGTGVASLSDFAWYQGADGWVPLSAVPGIETPASEESSRQPPPSSVPECLPK